ncbi:hypothetical protein Pdsh_04915 [Pyrodictium delaneyi]|uniref:Uncharacterized protein n=1 Tax=Pyrodictium delaneyi TaxID=1273541 RepID=A0A211YQ37_9CREN|nr:hypothetical protein Pdsh_04915 [Pyrodictium delaneyi]
MSIVHPDIDKLLEAISIDKPVVLTRKGNIIKIPYETRNIDIFKQIIADNLFRVRIGNNNLELLLFVDESSISKRYYVCIGSKVNVSTKWATVNDVLSGLRLRVKVPAIIIDDCMIELEWSKSRFVLTPASVRSCRRCQRVVL